jgi:hypothetical protein
MRRNLMVKSKVGTVFAFVLAAALGAPSFQAAHAASSKSKSAKAAPASDDATASTAGMSKDDQEKLKEHNKLRAEIKKVKYPASKNDIVAHVKGIKPDDKKWFSETLPEKTYTSADDVYKALGWPETPAPDAAK